MKLEDLRIYKLAMDFGEKIWNLVITWNNLATDTVGKQLIRSADSIAANISEGYGRYHIKEIRHFCYIARGSLFESKTWLTKATNRKLIVSDVFDELSQDLKDLGIRLNNYINSIGKNLPDQVEETNENYGLTDDELIRRLDNL